MVSDDTLRAVFRMPEPAVRLWGDAIRGVTLGLLALVLAAVTQAYAGVLHTTATTRAYQDFATFHASARQAAEERPIYERPGEPGALPPPGNLNPPHVALLLRPLAALPLPLAFTAWVTLSASSLAGTLWVAVRSTGLGRWPALGLAAGAYGSAAMTATLMSGQIGLLLAWPFAMSWRAARRGRPLEAAVWLGACAGVKPFLLLFVPAFLVARQWGAGVVAVLTCLAGFGAGLAAFGVDAHRDWVRELASVTWEEHYMNASLLGLLSRSLAPSAWAPQPLLSAGAAVGPAWLGAAAAVTGATIWRQRRAPTVDAGYGLTAAAALLVSPLGWIYYAWFLVGPIAGALRDLASWRPSARVLLVAGLAGLCTPPVAPWLALAAHQPWLTVTVGSCYAWAMLALWGAWMRAEPGTRR